MSAQRIEWQLRDRWSWEAASGDWTIARVALMGCETFEVWRKVRAAPGEHAPRWLQVRVRLPSQEAARHAVEQILVDEAQLADCA